MADKKMSLFFRFFSNPLVGIVGSVASVISLILAIYFYDQPTRHRELTYLVNPAKAVVVKAGQTSRLSVILEGKKLQSDVTAVQIAFWNRGSEPIRREHVLEPFVIHTRPRVPIIDASIRKKSREVTGISLDASRIGTGELGVSWKILEKNDGGIIQIIFAGGADTKISARAAIEGQPKIARSEPNTLERDQDPRESRAIFLRIIWVYIGLCLLMIAFGILRLWRFRAREGSRTRMTNAFMLIVMPIIAIALMIGLIFFVRPEQPFGF